MLGALATVLASSTLPLRSGWTLPPLSPTIPVQAEASMADTEQLPHPPHANGRKENGLGDRGAEFDRDLYGEDGDRYAGLDTSIGVAADDDQDFRERAMARYVCTQASGCFSCLPDPQHQRLSAGAAGCRPSQPPRTSSRPCLQRKSEDRSALGAELCNRARSVEAALLARATLIG